MAEKRKQTTSRHGEGRGAKKKKRKKKQQQIPKGTIRKKSKYQIKGITPRQPRRDWLGSDAQRAQKLYKAEYFPEQLSSLSFSYNRIITGDTTAPAVRSSDNGPLSFFHSNASPLGYDPFILYLLPFPLYYYPGPSIFSCPTYIHLIPKFLPLDSTNTDLETTEASPIVRFIIIC